MKSITKILAIAVLTISTVAINANADIGADGQMKPDDSSAPFGAVTPAKPVVPFNANNITLINNTFGIRADRPLDVRLLRHAVTTIEALYAQGRISGVEYDKLYNHVIRYSSGTACLSVFGVSCSALR